MTGVNTWHENLLPRNTEAMRAACAAATRGQAWVTGSRASTAAAAADESWP